MARMTGPQRREDIIVATVHVLLEKGLSSATTRDVTEKLGVGAGLLSHYFSWAALRALAFERIGRGDLERSLIDRESEPAEVVMADLIEGAFRPDADPVWRVWIEALDLATTDRELAEKVGLLTDQWRAALAGLLDRGRQQKHWTCDDPDGASWRILALIDGLVGMTLTREARLSRSEATRHLQVAVTRECGDL
jgi:TetR/AcrR family transcriptional regulator, transcriptional repressor of bet genes